MRRAGAGALLLALLACGAASRSAPLPGDPAPRRAETAGLLFSADTRGAIEATVLSLPSPLIARGAAEALLGALREMAPERQLVVLSDLPLAGPDDPRTAWLDTSGRDYSPWPRDPFTLARGRGGRVHVVIRPNLQTGREGDARMGVELVAGLPPALAERWGRPLWSRASTPFHNGQLLASGDALWLSLHSVEPRTLEVLDLPRVPVERFLSPGGALEYTAAARRAAAELADLYGRPWRLVHPLPDGGAGDPGLMRRLGGGAGYDLDSLVTLLETDGGALRALVADLSLGRQGLAGVPASDWEGFRSGYGIAPPAAELPRLLARAQDEPRGRALGDFLELVAAHLAGQGLPVSRLPLLRVPVGLLARGDLDHAELLVGWNNVVVSTDAAGALQAEGFASLLPTLDAAVSETFTAAGSSLHLLPPLIESVVRNGGYRCATNQLRAL
ncbi:MAG TPA: hypothetical protein VMT16_13700 [Thermoanaerobaculia bacterium]|nr:hypothetical protein [Thermoanaerobaculia bacterium]